MPDVTAATAVEATTRDRLLGGRLSIRQPARGHRAGSDAILLAASIAGDPGVHAIDFGAGVGTAGLAFARRCGARVLLVERDPALAQLASENAAANALDDLVSVHCGDVETLNAAEAGAFAGADHVLANPPFNPFGGRAHPDPRTAAARVAPPDLFDAWARAAARLLRPGGGFTLICRPDGLQAALAALGNRFGGVALRFVHPKPNAQAVRLLLGAVKGSRAPMRVEPALVLSGADGRFTQETEAIHRDAAALPLLR